MEKKSIINSFDDEEFAEIIKTSHTYLECMKNMGYHSYSGAILNLVKARIRRQNLSIVHFAKGVNIERTPENVFIKNTTACQSTVRDMYKKGRYTEYVCSICGQKPFWNGKPLTLIMDHVNGNNKDNQLTNLRWVCPNCNYQLDTTNGKNRNHGIRNINTCVECGKPISKTSTRCKRCNAPFVMKGKSKMPKERSELLNKIKQYGFEKTGRSYGVTGNAVRKWCKRLGLPYRAKDIM